MSRSFRVAVALAMTAAFCAPLAGALAPAPAVAAAGPRIVVTEISTNPTGADNFEFFEIANASTAPVDLGAEGYTFAYSYVDGVEQTKDAPLDGMKLTATSPDRVPRSSRSRVSSTRAAMQ